MGPAAPTRDIDHTLERCSEQGTNKGTLLMDELKHFQRSACSLRPRMTHQYQDSAIEAGRTYLGIYNSGPCKPRYEGTDAPYNSLRNMDRVGL